MRLTMAKDFYEVSISMVIFFRDVFSSNISSMLLGSKDHRSNGLSQP